MTQTSAFVVEAEAASSNMQTLLRIASNSAPMRWGIALATVVTTSSW
jgi:hypothetical protein